MLSNGPYDLLITDTIFKALQDRSVFKEPIAEHPEALKSYLVDLVSRKLLDALESCNGDGYEKAILQISLINDLLKFLNLKDLIPEKAEVLHWIGESKLKPSIPQTGLSHPWLFTSGKGMPSLLNEIRIELQSCDHLDILVSFITMSGLRKIRDILELITSKDALGNQKTKIRILTTTYMGATEKRALDELANLPGCEIRISLDGRRTRLHAKAWIFHRNTGFGTSYVGSANLSAAAMTGGLEWTVKFSQREQASLYERACANFETLWEDNEFQSYDPNNKDHQVALERALKKESGRDYLPSASLGFLEVSPKPFQQEILDQLAFERLHGRSRNLLVAATGTGKTVMAALDYKRFARENGGGYPRLLFVAHRIKILEQAQHTFQQVLGNSQFGDLLGDGFEPRSYEHLFVVINSIHSRKILESFGPNYWAMVIIDECHHIAAESFSLLVNSINPKVLLGLTATPERADGKQITNFFDSRPDGSPSAELRLWNALDLQLLTPFEYYGCDDETDFRDIKWNTNEELKQLSELFDGNDLRANSMLREWDRLTSNPNNCKTLIFCVSISHADFIAKFLNEKNIPSQAVHSKIERTEIQSAPQKLKAGEITAIVTVDLYNEGIDLPFVDTLILLRPTQSPVIFQQQIGRGLRLYEGKQSCLVLDFVGQYNQNFRFDRLLSGITGLSRKQLLEGISNGFPTLPSGCHLFLQRKTKDQVLSQLQNLIGQKWSVLIREIISFYNLNRERFSFHAFLEEYNLNFADIFRDNKSSGWLNLLEDAKILINPLTEKEKRFSSKLQKLVHFNDPIRIDAIEKIIKRDKNYIKNWFKYFYFLMEKNTSDEYLMASWMKDLLSSSRTLEELTLLHNHLEANCRLVYSAIPGLENSNLCLHGNYTAVEIGLLIGWFNKNRLAPITSGVLSLKEKKLEVFFVTLDKSEGFHERISYMDCAISQSLFKWQSQNSVGPHTQVGKRYLESESNGWQFQLFVRVNKRTPYTALGPVKLKTVEGSGPMTIIWSLEVPMGANIFRKFSVIGDS